MRQICLIGVTGVAPGRLCGRIGGVSQTWAERAAAAEAAVLRRHHARLWGLPGTRLGVVAWPARPRERRFAGWHYWWQAHLLDCLIDAQLRDPRPDRLRRIAGQIRGHRLRNLRWTNDYYDDMAWLALALERAGRLVGVRRDHALARLADELLGAWVPEDGGGIPWRKPDQFFNTPANGPAGIFLARYGRLRRAQQMADWIDETLVDPETHLVFDGIKAGSLVRAQYTYCQGVVLGLETELAARTDDPRHAARVHRLVAAVRAQLTDDAGVVTGGGGGDGGLFNGILARYLALVATVLPGDTGADAAARAGARTVVLASARAAWDNRAEVDGLPVFGPAWGRPARVPAAAGRAAEFVDGAVNPSEVPERDLSVQLSGWMLLEAAHALTPEEERSP